MSGSGEQVAERRQLPGTMSLVLGALAIAMIVFSVLPTPAPMWLRLALVFSVVPLGISAVVSGIVALRGMRDREGVDRFRARAGVTLGTLVVVVPLGVIVWGIWALNQAHP